MDSKELTTAEWEKIVKEAAQEGTRAGVNAAAWWEQDAIGGRTSSRDNTKETARRVLAGIEDGDPEILDSLPCPNLSGGWADAMTPARLLDCLGVDAESVTPEEESEICEAWEMAARDAVGDEIARLCAQHLKEIN